MIFKRLLTAIFAVGILAVLGLAGASLAGATASNGQGPPNDPPGQGECQHGNSGKECKPDPQPDHGKDCEEHGPKEGGVNEDHCHGTETTGTTTETTGTTTETTGTTTETTGTTDGDDRDDWDDHRDDRVDHDGDDAWRSGRRYDAAGRIDSGCWRRRGQDEDASSEEG